MSIPFRLLPVAAACLSLAACSGGGGGGGGNNGGGGPPAPSTYTVGGTIAGLAGSGLVLRNNGGNDLAVAAASATFNFSTALASGAAYNVTVATQPSNPSQACSVVAGASGSVGSANVSSVQLACTTNGFSVGATVTGLEGTGLVLQNNGGVDLPVTGNGTVTFPGQTLSGAAYAVTVKSQPIGVPLQLCSTTNGSGTVGNTSVSVAITCAPPVFKFLYVVNDLANSVSGFAVNAATGALTAVPGAPFATGIGARFASPDPSGRFLYVVNAGDNANPPSVSGYTVSSAGILAPLATSPYDIGVSPALPPFGLAFITPPIVHRSGTSGYVGIVRQAGGASQLYGASLDQTTGELSQLSGFPLDAGIGLGGTAFDAAGRILFMATNSAAGTAGEIRTYAVDTSGTLTAVGTFPTAGTNPSFPLLTPGENFVLTVSPSSGSLNVFAVSKTNDAPNGSLSSVGPPIATGPAGSRPIAISFNRRNNVFYVTNGALAPATPFIATFRLDPTTGVVTPVGSYVPTNGAAFGANLYPSGRYLGQYNNTTSSFQRFAIDPNTFEPSPVADVMTPTEAGPHVFLPDLSGKYLYVANQGAQTISSYRVDPSSGALTLIGTVANGARPVSISPFGFQPQ